MECGSCRGRETNLNKVKSPNQRVTNPRMTIHFDAAFNSRDFKSMAGMVAWDQKGVLLTTKTVLNSNVSSSFVAEAYVKLHVVKLGISMGLHSVTIKGDSRTIIKKCQTKAQDKSVIGAIIVIFKDRRSIFQEIGF